MLQDQHSDLLCELSTRCRLHHVARYKQQQQLAVKGCCCSPQRNALPHGPVLSLPVAAHHMHFLCSSCFTGLPAFSISHEPYIACMHTSLACQLCVSYLFAVIFLLSNADASVHLCLVAVMQAVLN